MRTIAKKLTVIVMMCAIVLSMVAPTSVYAASKPVPAKVTITGKSYNKTKNSVTLKWKKAKNTSRYVIYIRKANAKKWTKLATVSNKKTSYTYKSSRKYKLKKGNTYYFRMRAYNTKSKTYGKYSKSVKVNIATRVHIHQWEKKTHDVKVLVKDAYDETVTVKDAYDEKVIDQEAWDEDVTVAYCHCGAKYTPEHVAWANEQIQQAIITGDWTEAAKHNGCADRWETIHHDEVSHIVHHPAETKVVHHDAVYETVTTGRKCSKCGATR